jgi:hypothetical protein
MELTAALLVCFFGWIVFTTMRRGYSVRQFTACQQAAQQLLLSVYREPDGDEHRFDIQAMRYTHFHARGTASYHRVFDVARTDSGTWWVRDPEVHPRLRHWEPAPASLRPWFDTSYNHAVSFFCANPAFAPDLSLPNFVERSRQKTNRPWHPPSNTGAEHPKQSFANYQVLYAKAREYRNRLEDAASSCPRCGAHNPDLLESCPSCDTPLLNLCPGCGHENLLGDISCHGCEEPLATEAV